MIALAVLGSGYTLHAALLLRRLARQRGPVPVATAAVTLLKPLHGAEPQLHANLATFLKQRHHGPVQLLCGVQRADDPAIAVVEALRRDFPAAHIDLVVDPTSHGGNAKVANLANMAAGIAHDTVVLSDSDMAVPVDYLARAIEALAAPGVGAVTCLYQGRGDAGFWSAMGAAAVSYAFLPQVLVSRSLGDRRACMGSTIALRRETLAAIGGFARFADDLADDYAIGAAVRDLGLAVAVPPMVLVHAATERSVGELWRHELRWAATVRTVVSAPDYGGVVLTQPLAPALLAILVLPRAGLAATALALAVRVLLTRSADRTCGARPIPLWLLPLRDLFSSGVFVASLFVRSVDWRGRRLTLKGDGRISGPAEPTPE